MEISDETIDQCKTIPILDSKGQSRDFGSLITSGGGSGSGSGKGSGKGNGKCLVIFIRHFFCGLCQDYTRALCSSISLEELQNTQPTPISVVIIGCGQPDLIEMYKSETNCHFDLYAEPTRKIYDKLGMTKTLELAQKKPEYFQTGLLTAVAQSIYQGIRAGTGALKGGDIKQVGGEFLFEDGKLLWSYRMKNTQDHTEVPELRRIIGLDKKTDEPPVKE